MRVKQFGVVNDKPIKPEKKRVRSSSKSKKGKTQTSPTSDKENGGEMKRRTPSKSEDSTSATTKPKHTTTEPTKKKQKKKHQRSIASFFSSPSSTTTTGKKKKKKEKRTTPSVASFFSRSRTQDAKKSSSALNDEDAPKMDEEDVEKESSSDRRKKRKVIDSDDDEEDVAASAHIEKTPPPRSSPVKKSKTCQPDDTQMTCKESLSSTVSAGKSQMIESNDGQRTSSDNASAQADPTLEASRGAQNVSASKEDADLINPASSSTLRKYKLWKAKNPVPYSALASVFQYIESTTKRLDIQAALTTFLCDVVTLTPNDLLPVVYLASNKLAPQFEGVELGIGDSTWFYFSLVYAGIALVRSQSHSSIFVQAYSLRPLYSALAAAQSASRPNMRKKVIWALSRKRPARLNARCSSQNL